MTDLATVLAASPLFGGMQPAHRKRLAASAFARTCGKGEVLFHEGEPGDAVYLVIRGNIQAHKTDPEGNQAVIKIFQPGEMFAQVILFERRDYPVTALALTHATVAGLYRRDVLAELEHEAFRNDFIAQLMQRQRFLAGRLSSLASPDVEDRFRQFLRDSYGKAPRIRCELKRKDLAAAIGVTPETLSRLLGRLKKDGRLMWTGREIVADQRFWR